LVQPEGIGNIDDVRPEAESDEAEDPLLNLFRLKAELSSKEFHLELSKQRGGHPVAPETTVRA
jgi:hypothetical protein